MATVGPKLTIPFIVGAGAIVGQGYQPETWVLYSTDNADVELEDLTWTSVPEPRVRDWDTARGRESELATVGGGTASITLDNRNRAFDPISNPLIHTGNRWWIRYQFSGVTGDVFKGHAEEYNMEFGGFADALTTVSCVDEFGPLSTDELPTTDPPRDSYQDVAMFDVPTGYWSMDSVDGATTCPAVVGEGLALINGPNAAAIINTQGAIVGQTPGAYVYLTSTGYLQTPDLLYAQSGDAGGLGEFAVETWLSIEGAPSGTELLISGPNGIPSATYTWKLSLNTSRQLVLETKNTSGTVHTCTSTTALTSAAIGPSNVWYHIVGTIDGGSLRLYVNGVQESSTAWTGTFEFLDNANHMIVGNAGTTIGANARAFDEMAFYRVGLSAARVAAHYTAGASRGFPRQQEPGDRITAVLTAAGNLAPRSIRTGTNNMTGTYMVGQSPLEEMRKGELAESVDAVLFVAKDGTVTFLDDGHRSVSPWNTIQATFDDDGTDLPYLDVKLTPSNAFLANIWNATKVGGTLAEASDATSISKHGRRTPQKALTDLPITTDADVTAIVAAMLAKYKDPLVRISALELDTAVAAVAEAVLGLLDIGSRVRVFRTHPGGGARIDQTSFVQSIKVKAANDGKPWKITLGISPL